QLYTPSTPLSRAKRRISTRVAHTPVKRAHRRTRTASWGPIRNTCRRGRRPWSHGQPAALAARAAKRQAFERGIGRRAQGRGGGLDQIALVGERSFEGRRRSIRE